MYRPFSSGDRWRDEDEEEGPPAAELARRAVIRDAQGRYEDADQLYDESLERGAKPFTGWQWMPLDLCRTYRKGLEIRERALGPGHPGVAHVVDVTAGVLKRLGREEASSAYDAWAQRILESASEAR